MRLIASVVMHWVATICLLQIMYDGATIIVIGSDLGRIERWGHHYSIPGTSAVLSVTFAGVRLDKIAALAVIYI